MEYDQTVTCHKGQGGASRGTAWTRAVPKKSHIVSSQLTEASWLSCSSSCFLEVRLYKVHCNNNLVLKMPHKQFDKKFDGKKRFFQKSNTKDRKTIATKCVEAL